MEPDHAAMIEAVLVRWPDLRLVVNAKTLPMLKCTFPRTAPPLTMPWW